jgi:hypothetical protein
LAPPCPWSNLVFRPAEFCEESLCAWLRQPANTWTNIGFFIVAIWILRSARRDRCEHLRGLVWIVLATGLGSAFFHASETLAGRLFDYGGMYLGAAYMVGVNVRRWLLLGRRAIRRLFWAAAAGPVLLMLIEDRYAMTLYALIGILCCVFLEVYLFLRQRRHGMQVHYRWLGAYWSFFLLGLVFWWLDKERLLCRPDNHWITGHGLWHLLCALSFCFVYLFYRQFDVLRFPEAKRIAQPPHSAAF